MDRLKHNYLAFQRLKTIQLKALGIIIVSLISIMGLSACGAGKSISGLTESKNLYPDNKPSIAHGQSGPAGKVKKPDNKAIIQKAMKLRMPFIANEGQMAKEVSFYAKTFGGTAYVTQKGEMVYSFPGIEPKDKATDSPSKPKDIKGVTLKETLVGASVTSPKGNDRSQTKVNYFIGNDKSKWKTNIPTYNSISLGEIYNGIDLSLKAYGKTVEKVFTVKPGADPKAIILKMEGSQALKINEQGELEVQTDLGQVRFSKPLAYQEKNGKRENVQVAYHIEKDVYGFRVDNYDTALPLVIDPAIIYSTRLGGHGEERHEFDNNRAIAMDASGNVYVTGTTVSTNFPTVNAIQGTSIDYYDAFVTKLSADGSSLIYSTYLGGSRPDLGFSLTVDVDGNVYITGETGSLDFPVTEGAFQVSNPGGYDAFVTKLSSDGSDLIYSTYLRGNNSDIGTSIAINTSGNAYVTGFTRSTDFPVTEGAFQASNLGEFSVFVTKLNADGSGLVYSSFLGGSGFDYSYGIAVDAADNAFVTGQTYSSDFPTANAFQTSIAGSSDAFVAKILPDGSGLVYSTYLGGNGGERSYSITLNTEGNAYVAGETGSSDFSTANAFQTSIAGSSDAFVAKLSADGSGLVYFTYVGGSSGELGRCITLDTVGNIYLTGRTASIDFPVANAIQTSNSGIYDAFVMKILADGSGLVYSTYLGGSGEDASTGIAVDSSGNVCVMGMTNSTDFPTTNAFLSGTSDSYDVFIAKIAETVWYVKLGGSGSQDGSSWDDAFPDIQDAIDATGAGDEIWVAQGNYALFSQIDVNETIHIYGGFDGTETARNQRDWQNNVTTVDGQDSVFHCFYITEDATIDGFTISRGNANGASPDNAGGGILIDSCSPTIANCTLTGNGALYGGGIANFTSSSAITNCIFSSNDAISNGGAIYNDFSPLYYHQLHL